MPIDLSAPAVARFLDQDGDADLIALVGDHLPIVTAFVRSYTRGGGFFAGEPNDDLAAVIITATARLVTNPDQVKREQIGDYQVTPTVFDGFSLPETMVLHRYRKRSA